MGPALIAETRELPPGLYLIATPIGNARDITLRALDILASAQVLAAEDTRSLRRLMEIHGVPLRDRRILAYHDHNGPKMRPRLLAEIAAGRSLAYASEAGTPMIADPGFVLAREAVAQGLPVTAAPGPSALVAALTVAALPTDRVHFAGFLPPAQAARRRALEGLRAVEATLVLYESPRRLGALLADAAEVLGPERAAAVCRELTKKFEDCRRAPLAQLADEYRDTPPKGEIVLVVDRGRLPNVSEGDVEEELVAVLQVKSVRDAAADVAARFGLPRREVYQKAMALRAGQGGASGDGAPEKDD